MISARLVKTAFLCGTLAIAALASVAAPAAHASPPVVSLAVQFQVRNVNRSLVPCSADGGSYVIAGHLIGPATALDHPSAATLYLHGLGFNETFWDFQAVPDYDYASALAAAGQVSVVIDRLGYPPSSMPLGGKTCVGAQADVAHQIVGELRTGNYDLASRSPVAFNHVALAGHSAGGLIAQIEAYSFRDVDGLVVMSWADLGASTRAVAEFAQTGGDCILRGQSYAPLGQSADSFDQIMFHDADPAVVSAATASRTLDPCGDTSSIPLGLVIDVVGVLTVRVPVLLVYGANDALFPPPAGQIQRLLYVGDGDVTMVTLPSTGHAVTLERSAPQLRATVGSWLTGHGL